MSFVSADNSCYINNANNKEEIDQNELFQIVTSMGLFADIIFFYRETSNNKDVSIPCCDKGYLLNVITENMNNNVTSIVYGSNSEWFTIQNKLISKSDHHKVYNGYWNVYVFATNQLRLKYKPKLISHLILICHHTPIQIILFNR